MRGEEDDDVRSVDLVVDTLTESLTFLSPKDGINFIHVDMNSFHYTSSLSREIRLGGEDRSPRYNDAKRDDVDLSPTCSKASAPVFIATCRTGAVAATLLLTPFLCRSPVKLAAFACTQLGSGLCLRGPPEAHVIPDWTDLDSRLDAGELRYGRS